MKRSKVTDYAALMHNKGINAHGDLILHRLNTYAAHNNLDSANNEIRFTHFELYLVPNKLIFGKKPLKFMRVHNNLFDDIRNEFTHMTS